MNKQRIATMMLLVLFVLCAPVIYSQEHYDHPEIGRYENSSILHKESSNYDRYRLGLGIVRNETISETLTVEGKVMMTLYSGPETASSFEVISAYRRLLLSEQFEILFSCEKSACGEDFLGAFYDLAPFANDPGWNNSAPITQGNPDASYVMVAKSENEERTRYVSIIVSQGWWSYPVYKLDVVEIQEHAGEIVSVGRPGEDIRDTGRASSEPVESRQIVPRPMRYGLQVSSDTSLGFLIYANHFEICPKVQVLVYDGYPGNDRPGNLILVGAHASYLFRLSNRTDLGVGIDVRLGINLPSLSSIPEYKQYIDGGLRLSCSYHLGNRFMVSGLLYPGWVHAEETEENDSYSLDAKLPSAGVAVSFFL